MNLTQENLQRTILGVMIFCVLVAIFVLRNVSNIALSIFLGLVIVVLPFWLDSLVRYRVIPWLDTLNESPESRRGDSDDFPLWLRVLIWAFLGIIMASAWTFVVPFIFGLHLWLGRIALAIGWKAFALTDVAWQYGWLIVFLVQYVVSFGVGFMTSDDNVLEDRFAYPY